MLFTSKGHAASPFPVKFRQQPAYDSLLAFVEPGRDEFPGEKIAIEIEARLHAAMADGQLPLAAGCMGVSPLPQEYRTIGPGVSAAVFGAANDVASGWKQWRESLGTIHGARFFSLPADVIRYQIRGERAGRLEYRVGTWKQSWSNGSITRFEPIEEILTHADKPWFRDVTAGVFEGEPSFHEQLARGVPYWRARLDPACGIDLYGELGIAVADIDGDGRDEIYVCQPGGLPNRLYKHDGNGRLRDVSKAAGLDLLDNTQTALFVDLRNSGQQDLVLMRTTRPMLSSAMARAALHIAGRCFPFSNRTPRPVHQRSRSRL